MHIIATDDWHNSHTDLSKYLLARFAQLVDVDEVISYRYPTTNGYILLEELHAVAGVTLERWKNNHRLKTLLAECSDFTNPASIANDPIINRYFRPVKNDILAWSKETFNFDLVKRIERGALVHASTLRKEYTERLWADFHEVDLKSQGFDRVSAEINRLSLTLIPHLLYDEHSLGFLQRAPQNLKERSPHRVVEKLFRYFSFGTDREYQCFIAHQLSPTLDSALEARPHDIQLPNSTGLKGMMFKALGRDPISALRNKVTQAYRKISLRVPTTDPGILEPIWLNSYYYRPRFGYIQYDFDYNSDPIVPSFRPNTLTETLRNARVSLDDTSESVLGMVEESLYFYNTARVVPSVENSYILLWTALEALMGLKTDKSDIEVVQDNVAQPLALGAVGRRINATVQRLRTTGNANKWKYLGPRYANEYDRLGLCRWMGWLTDQTDKHSLKDPFTVLKEDPLLCMQYRNINEKWLTYKDLLRVLKVSERMTRYQLDRLYLTRNRIVHSGHFGHTGIYQWVHLEWYVGKMLAQAILILNELPDHFLRNPLDAVFGCLVGQYRATLDFLDRHSGQSITTEGLIASGITRFPALCY